MENPYLTMIDENWKKVVEKDQYNRQQGNLVGRYVQVRYADGYAYYEIIRENKKSARLRVILNIGDDWVLPQWGLQYTATLEFVMDNIRQRDRMDDLNQSRKLA